MLLTKYVTLTTNIAVTINYHTSLQNNFSSIITKLCMKIFWRYVALFFTFKNEIDIFVNWITSLSYSFGIDIISKNYFCISLYSSMGFYYSLTITFRKSSFVCLWPIILFGRPLILISISYISNISYVFYNFTRLRKGEGEGC